MTNSGIKKTTKLYQKQIKKYRFKPKNHWIPPRGVKINVRKSRKMQRGFIDFKPRIQQPSIKPECI